MKFQSILASATVLMMLLQTQSRKVPQKQLNKTIPHTNRTMASEQFDHYYIHLIPHTHDDVGWRKNPDQYFSGTAMYLTGAYVELIIDSVVQALLNDPIKKFSYVEMKYFTMWWSMQTDQMKDQVRMLVNEGRLEFINAGWSMNDEACPHYEDILNNMMIGHDFLKKEFGVAPRIGWQIDPFGHSNANARLFAEMGFDAVFFARIDYEDHHLRRLSKEFEFIWRPMYDHLGSRSQIFTYVMSDFYFSPSGLNFDPYEGGNDPFIDDPNLETYNADDLASYFYNYLIDQKDDYLTNHMFIPMGGDFNYMNAQMHFESLDKMIKFMNNKYSDITLFYSTPSEYVDAVHSYDVVWPTKYDDFFPYADNEDSFWTGYFSSRQNDKEYIRRASHNLMASNNLYGLKMLDQSLDSSYEQQIIDASFAMFDSMGVNQHHDAVTGTSHQAVANDYAWRLFKSMEKNNKIYTSLIEELASESAGIETLGEWEWCFKENTTYLDCPISKYSATSTKMLVAIHNSADYPERISKIQVPHSNYDVYGFSYERQAFEKVKAYALCDLITLKTLEVVDNCNLYVDHLILDSSVGFISLVSNPNTDLRVQKQQQSNEEEIVQIENDYEILTYLESTSEGQLFQLTKKKYNQTFKFAFDIRYYPAFESSDSQPSGVYIFRPAQDCIESLQYTKFDSVTFQKSDIVSEIILTYLDPFTGARADVIVRMTKDAAFTEWFVNLGGVPNYGIGTEVTINFQSLDIDNKDTFYTDSNGLEMQKRVLNQRPTWDWDGKEKISGNYYPIQTAISIKDTDKKFQMTLMNSRSQGGSSLKKGRVELMQQRRLFYDDWRGMGETLDERDEFGNPINVPAIYYLQIFNYEEEPSLQRKIQMKQDEPLQYFFSFNPKNLENLISESEQETESQSIEYSNLENIIKMNLFPIKKNSILLRIENIADKFDDVTNSNTDPLKINVQRIAENLFVKVNGDLTLIDHINIVEKALTGNQDYSEMWAKKLQWKTVDDCQGDIISMEVESNQSITLERQRIRTFELNYILKTQVAPNFIN